ncbi:tetratricopeptide repeat protein 12 isoform X2 [Meleagris gallopavo]|uniref:tetratricopeptide repeat protein 12 isoform X2 n=1 Tax=Meleagris gallopavo TaxID=9103 RepID=UPI00093DC138|nr:tetratricopeptide repeat protein 12 isoform X2 [Meleagris gallopavo]
MRSHAHSSRSYAPTLPSRCRYVSRVVSMATPQTLRNLRPPAMAALADPQQEEEFQRFLRRVDDISRLVQGLSSADAAVRDGAIAEADRRLREQRGSEQSAAGADRTVINTRHPDSVNTEAVHTEGFLAALEKDAKERAKQRKRNERLANALKEKGNDAFRKGDYNTAAQRYTDGLQKLKDVPELYTNRAQAYLKMHEYGKAIGDCEWALKSRQCYQKLLQLDPQKKSLFKDCMNEVNLEEKRMQEEDRAMKAFQSGKDAALSIKDLLQKLNRPDQNILYYTGGIQVLIGVVKECTEQTLFRTNNGFSIINDNEVIRRGFCAGRKSTAEVDLCVSLLSLWQAVCAGNEENQRLLLTHPDVNAQLLELLCSGVLEIQKETLALIALYSDNENGRRLLIRHQDLSRWLQILMMFVNSTDARASSAMSILSDLIQEEKFKAQCRLTFSTSVLPLFIQLLASAKLVDQTALSCCIGIMGNLCADAAIRVHMAECKECWQACLQLVDGCADVGTPKYRECVFAVLGLMMNLLLESNSVIQCLAVDISGRCMSLLRDQDGRTVTRAIGVLSRILAASSLAVEEAVKGGVVKKMIKFLKAGGQTTSSYAIKTLSICTRSSRQAQEEVVKSDKKFSVLLKLLDSENEMIVGNAAFCLGQCLVVPGAATSLLNSNIVMALLKHAGGDAARTSVQENAAIALGKLCVAEPRHIFQLRELNGMAILNSSMKYVHSS